MSDLARSALEAAGWSAERDVDVAPHESALRSAGYAVWPSLLNLIREFAGLTVRFERNGRPDTAWFDPARAVRWADAQSVKAYEDRIHRRLAPVGYGYHDHMLLLASEAGQIFGTFDDFLADLGNSPVQAVENLIAGNVRPLSEEL